MSIASKKKREFFIEEILKEEFGEKWLGIYNSSDLLQYLNLKSGAIHGNSKSRRALANWYAIYSILHFYLEEGFFNDKKKYLEFEGFKYSKLYEFQRTLYGGSKLQNHGFNSRANDEFANKTNLDTSRPLIVKSNGRYLIHPDYLYVDDVDITRAIVHIVDAYKEILHTNDNSFVMTLEKLQTLTDTSEQKETLKLILTDDSEARIFEIISYAILETHYKNKTIYLGWSVDELQKEYLQLYKTGRTNANDGGIDFVMRPLGRFFQVTEVDVYDKYFLDIEKVNHFPLTFVIKTTMDKKRIKKELLDFGTKKSGGLQVLEKQYHDAIEEVITINELVKWMDDLSSEDTKFLIDEIDRYFKMEMNLD